VTPDQLERLELWHRAAERARCEYSGLSEKELVSITIRNVFDYQVEDVIKTAAQRLADYEPRSVQDVMNAPERIVDFGPELKALLEPYRAFLFKEIYWRFDATSMDISVQLMRKLFFFYMEHPEEMGGKARAEIESYGLWRSVCDYVSGMTDRYAMMECEKFELV
jgi:dGTPase